MAFQQKAEFYRSLWIYLLKGQMSSTLKYLELEGIQELVRRMAQIDDSDLIYKGPWVRSAKQRLFQTLETDYGFPRATCRSLVNLIWDFLTETFGEKLHEGQITFHAASAAEPPGKSISEIKSVPVHLTFHDRTDMEVLTKEGTSGLRRHKILRMARESCGPGRSADPGGSGRPTVQFPANDQTRYESIERSGNRCACSRNTSRHRSRSDTQNESSEDVLGGYEYKTSNARQVTPASRSRDIFPVSLRLSDSTVEVIPHRKYVN
jgi:hypothetical protein